MSAAIPRSVCAGPIDTHVVRPEFTCHHCSWALRADVGIAFQRAIVVGVAVALTTLALTSSHPYTLTTPTQTNPPIWASFQVFNTIMNKRKHVESALTLWDRIVYGGIATMFGLTIGCGSGFTHHRSLQLEHRTILGSLLLFGWVCARCVRG